MEDLTGLDGSFEKALASANSLKGLPSILQKFMAAGVVNGGLTFTKPFDEESIKNSGELENIVAQLAALDKEQQKAFINISNFDKSLKTIISDLLKATEQGEKFNSVLFEQIASQEDSVSKGVLNEVMQESGMKDSNGNYLLTNTKDVCTLMEQYANDTNNAEKAQQLFNAGLLEETKNGYKVSQSLLKTISAKGADTAATYVLTAAQKAWNITMQLGKQLLLSLGIAAVSFIATKIVDYIMNLKTHSEELLDTMNDSHDKAEQATKDVEEIQSKIDELNKSLENAGVKQISDIVDPAERERLQAINDMLEAQLALRKETEKDTKNQANKDTSAVANDATEDSIIKTHTEKLTYAEGGGNAGTKQVADKITKTESLNEHSDYLDQLVQKRREMAAAGEEETQAYKDNEAEIEKEKAKVEELSAAVSEQADKYETDADNFSDYKDEYIGCTDAIKSAAASIKNANDGLAVDTTNLDIVKEKIKDIQDLIANGDGKAKGTNRSDYGYLNAIDSLKASGVTTGEDILNLASKPSQQTDEQSKAIAILKKEAREAKVSLEEYVGALEQSGEVATKAATKTRGLANTMTLLDNMQSGYQTCASAVDEYNKKGYVTMDTLQSLINLEPQYMSMLEMKNGKLKINGKTAQKLTDVYIELARAELLTDTITKIKETNSLEKAQTILAEVKSVLGDAESQFMSAQHEAAVEAYKTDGMAGYDAVMRAAKQEWENYKLQDELLQKLGKQKPSDIWGKDSSSSKQASSALDAWSTLSSAMEEYNKQGSISLNTMKSLMGLEAKYTACLEKQGDQLTINATAFRNMIQSELATAAASGTSADKVAQYVQILQYLDENAVTGTISLNELRDAIEGVGASLDKAQEKTSGLKSAFGTIHDILNTDNPTGALTSDDVESVIDLIQEHKELQNVLYDENGNIAINEESLKKATIALLENEKAATKNVAIQNLLQKSIDALSSGVIKITDYLKGLNTQLDDIKNKTDKFKSGFETINEIIDEYNTYGQLSYDSYEKLLYLDPQYLKCIEQVGNQLKFNTDAYQDLYTAELAAASVQYKGTAQGDMFNQMLKDVTGLDNIDKITEAADKYAKAKEHYNDVVKQYSDVQTYGNVDNFHRGVIEWNEENLAKYHEFAEQEGVQLGEYSTVLGESNAFWTGDGENQGEKEIAYTPMLQTEDGVVPLTADEIYNYVNDVVEKAARLEGGATAENILKVDAGGLFENVAGDEIKVHGMIAAVEGQIVNGAELAAADVRAIGGESAESIKADLGETSKYAGKSMHDIQGAVTDAANEMNAAYDDVTNSTKDMEKASGNSATRMKLHFGGVKDTMEELKSTISNIKDLFSSLLNIFSSANDKKSNGLKIQGDAWIDVIDKRIDAINEQNDAQERALELQKLQDAYEKAKANKTTRVYTSNGYEWQADESAVREARNNLNDKIRENRKQDEIDRLTKLKEEIQKNIDLIGTSWDDYQKKLAYTAQFEAMTYDEMVAHNDVFASAVIANMKAVQAATNVSNIISKLETLIDVLTKLGNVLGNFNGSTSSGGLAGLGNRFKNALSVFTDKSSGKGFFGRLGDSVKTFFGFGSGGTGSGGSSGSGIIDSIVNFFGTAKKNITSAAQSIFSGDSGLSSIFQKGFGGVISVAQKAMNGFGSVFGNFSSMITNSGLFSTVTGIFTKLGTTVTSAGGALAKVAGLAIGKIPVIGPLLLGGTVALGALGGGSVWNGVKKIGSAIGSAFKGIGKAVTKVAKGIGSTISKAIKGIGGFLFGKTKSDGTKSRGVLGTIGHAITAPIRWVGKLFGFASGTKKVEQTGAYNVDEQGEEMIVRNPEKGRATTLEKGDGVIPANQTATLMSIAKSPIKWLRKNLAKVTGSTAVAVGATQNDSDQEAITQAKETADKIDTAYSSAFDNIKSASKVAMQSMASSSGTIGKLFGGISGLFDDSSSGGFLKMVSSSSFAKISSSISKIFGKFKSMFDGTSSITTMSDLLTGSKKKTLSQLDAMKKSFEDTWNSMAEATGVSKDDITKTSAEMYDKVNRLVNDTYAAINDNTGMNAEQVEKITETLFTSMDNIYTSGWNKIASTTSEMTEENANTIAAAYKKSHDACEDMMKSTASTMKNGWSKVGGGVRNLSAKTENTISQAWADTSGDTEKMLYDMRACFDSSWGMAEKGVKRLADGTESTLEDAYTTIKSTSGDAFNSKLPSDAANAWSNVEPGAKDLQENLTWVMNQAYDAITKGCDDTVSSIKEKFSTTGDELYNFGQTKNTSTSSSSSSNKSSSSSSSSGSSGGSSSSSTTNTGNGKSLSSWWKEDMYPAMKDAYNSTKEKVSSTVSSVKEKVSNSSVGKATSAVKEKVSSAAKDVKEKVSSIFKKKATGARKINQSDVYNVDEQGSELMVRQPQAGRYTYLEAGDGVVPADITSRLFEMGGNPDAWFQNQMSKYSAPITSAGGSNMSVSMGNIVIQNPVGNSDDLANEIVRELPNKLSQKLNMR